MKGPKTASIAHKKLGSETMMKKRKAEAGAKEKKTSKNNPGAPKRPSGAFFIFMEDFRKTYKENFPDNKSISAVGKAGGDKWKSMSESEKAPYSAKALKRKEEYEKAMEAFKRKANGDGEEKAERSEKSISEIQDDAEQEGSS